MKNLLPYAKERALEDTFAKGLQPMRLFTLFLPVWQVEVRATTVEGRPYDLIDRYLERGIADGGLRTAAELAGFFALDPVLVDRALRFLHRLGHLTQAADGTLGLTRLGQDSHRDQKRYVVTREDRRTLYFDAYSCQPLSRRYYDPGLITFLTPAQIHAAGTANQDFRLLFSATSFDPEALTRLARLSERHHFNLPDRLEDVRSQPATCVYLPIFLVRAMNKGGTTRLLAYSQAADTEDAELSDLCQRTPQITGTLANEDSSEQEQRKRIEEWLGKFKLQSHRPARFPYEAWRVVLPVSAFEPDGPFPLARLGSFTALKTTVVRVWCEDRTLRERALIERVDAYLESRERSGEEAAALVARVGTQLGFDAIDLPRIRALASAAGRAKLVSRVDHLLPGNVR